MKYKIIIIKKGEKIMKRNNQKRAFTIVELVIVIAVIAILAAVLIPTYTNLVKKANEAKAQVEAKNLVTEMLAEILTGKDGDADLLVFSHNGKDVYLYGYSTEECRVFKYSGNLAAFEGDDFKAFVNDTLLSSLTASGAVTEVSGLDADDWRNPTKTAEIVANLDVSGDMVVYANYKIVTANFASGEELNNSKFPAYIGGKGYESVDEAIDNCGSGDTIVVTKSAEIAAMNIENKNINFVVKKGARLNADTALNFGNVACTDEFNITVEEGAEIHATSINVKGKMNISGKGTLKLDQQIGTFSKDAHTDLTIADVTIISELNAIMPGKNSTVTLNNVKVSSTSTSTGYAIKSNGEATVNINGGEYISASKDVKDSDKTAAIYVADGTYSLDGNVKVQGESRAIYVTSTGKVNIKSGDFSTAGDVAVYIDNSRAKLNISGGRFSVGATDKKYTINVNDDYRNAISSIMEITGGEYVGFDPANSTDGNLVAEGYKSVESNGVWTVVKN